MNINIISMKSVTWDIHRSSCTGDWKNRKLYLLSIYSICLPANERHLEVWHFCFKLLNFLWKEKKKCTNQLLCYSPTSHPDRPINPVTAVRQDYRKSTVRIWFSAELSSTHPLSKKCPSASNVLLLTGARIPMLGKVHLKWQGGGGRAWRYWNSKLEILAVPLANGSIF